jgi:hypothetical protein
MPEVCQQRGQRPAIKAYFPERRCANPGGGEVRARRSLVVNNNL